MNFAKLAATSLTILLLCCQTLAFAAQQPEQSVSERHEQLIPVVAVADMFFACNRATHSDGYDHQLDDLVKQMDKNTLADKLITCLAGQELKSDIALNYGLVGCFHAQMRALSEADYQQKMAELVRLLPSLARAERQQTFSQCVTEQAIYYLD